MVCQCSLELAVIDAAEGQRRQPINVEPADAESLKRRWRLHGAVAAAEENSLRKASQLRRVPGVPLRAAARSGGSLRVRCV
jgi:hypothetical protein